MKKVLRRILRIAAVLLLLLIIAAFLVPILFKTQIANLVKKEINNSLVAKVEFTDVSLSLFRHFPKISISLDAFSVVGSGDFAGDTLLSSESIEASVNLFSAIRGKNIKVYGVYFESPRIHALVNKNGEANWEITKPTDSGPDPGSSTPSEFKMRLEKYEINNGYVYYKDESGDMSAEITGLNHEGSGDFTSSIFTLATETKAESVSFTYESIPYLLKTRTLIKSDIEVDNTTSKYSFKTEDVVLNDLRLNAEGFFQLVNDSTYGMDIRFNTPSNDFKHILSLVPAIYKQDFDKIKTGGQAALKGFVKGVYSPVQFPAYDVNLEVKDGSFQYPDLPKPVKNIQIALHAVNQDGKPDNAIIDISKGHLEMDNEPFDFRLLFKNPESARYLDAMAKGKLDLANLSKFVKLEGGTELAGLVWADLFAKGNMSALASQQGPFTAGGFLDIKDLSYSSAAFPQPIRNGDMKVQVENKGGIADNTSVSITEGHVELGKDPVDFTFTLRKPMTTVDFSGAAKGQFTLDHLRQFVQLESGTSISGLLRADMRFTGNKAAIDRGDYDQVAISGDAGLSGFRYQSKDYPSGLSLSTTQLQFNQKTVVLKELSGDYLNTHFNASGNFHNPVGFALKDEPLTGTLNVSADKMKLDQWMGTDGVSAADSANSTASGGPFLVPSNVNLTLNARAGNVTYEKVDYKNIAGTLVIRDEAIQLQNVKAEALDGTMAFNGSYSTKNNTKEPAITMSYDVSGLDVQKTFYAFNTVQKLMPIGQFLSGKLSSALTMTGHLGGDMMPDLGSLSGKGNLLLLEGVLKKFAPLERLANTLQVEELRSITIKDVKNYIEFSNGKVLVRPFTVKVKDIEMQIGGLHGFDQSIDYSVQMKLPRKYLGKEGNDLLNHLVSQASAKGIAVNPGEVVNLNIKMGGTFANPSIRTDLKEVAGDAVRDMQQQAADFAKAKADSAKQTVKDSLASVKKQVLDDLKEEAKNKIFGNPDSTKKPHIDSTKKKAEQTIKNTFDKLLNRKKKESADSTKRN